MREACLRLRLERSGAKGKWQTPGASADQLGADGLDVYRTQKRTFPGADLGRTLDPPIRCVSVPLAAMTSESQGRENFRAGFYQRSAHGIRAILTSVTPVANDAPCDTPNCR